MTLPDNAVRYDTCSLQELRQFVSDRKITFRYTHAESHTKKSQIKGEKGERRKLLAVLQKADATATFRLLDLPPELRDEVYWHFFVNQEVRYYFFMDREQLVTAEDCQHLQRIPEQIRNKMSAVFTVLQCREVREKKIDGTLSSGNIHIGVDLELFLGTGSVSLVWISQRPDLLPLYRPNPFPSLMDGFTNRIADIRPQSHCSIFKLRSSSMTDFVPEIRVTLNNEIISSQDSSIVAGPSSKKSVYAALRSLVKCDLH